MGLARPEGTSACSLFRPGRLFFFFWGRDPPPRAKKDALDNSLNCPAAKCFAGRIFARSRHGMQIRVGGGNKRWTWHSVPGTKFGAMGGQRAQASRQAEGKEARQAVRQAVRQAGGQAGRRRRLVALRGPGRAAGRRAGRRRRLVALRGRGRDAGGRAGRRRRLVALRGLAEPKGHGKDLSSSSSS